VASLCSELRLKGNQGRLPIDAAWTPDLPTLIDLLIHPHAIDQINHTIHNPVKKTGRSPWMIGSARYRVDAFTNT
jgi:hypothetical protein